MSDFGSALFCRDVYFSGALLSCRPTFRAQCVWYACVLFCRACMSVYGCVGEVMTNAEAAELLHSRLGVGPSRWEQALTLAIAALQRPVVTREEIVKTLADQYDQHGFNRQDAADAIVKLLEG